MNVSLVPPQPGDRRVAGSETRFELGQACSAHRHWQAAPRLTAQSRFLSSVRTLSQNLERSPSESPIQIPRTCFLPSKSTPTGQVSGPIGDDPITDLDVQRVDVEGRIHLIEGPVPPLIQFVPHRIGDPGDHIRGDVDPVDLLQMRTDVPHRHPPSVENTPSGPNSSAPSASTRAISSSNTSSGTRGSLSRPLSRRQTLLDRLPLRHHLSFHGPRLQPPGSLCQAAPLAQRI